MAKMRNLCREEKRELKVLADDFGLLYFRRSSRDYRVLRYLFRRSTGNHENLQSSLYVGCRREI
jgi:hypothetical protein